MGLQRKTAGNRDGTNTVAPETAVRLYSCYSTVPDTFSTRYNKTQEMYC